MTASEERRKRAARRLTARRHHLKSNFSMSLEEYAARLKAQDYRCKICRRRQARKNFCVDHNHACCAAPPTCGKCTRGLICSYDNRVVLGILCSESKLGAEGVIAYAHRLIEYVGGET